MMKNKHNPDPLAPWKEKEGNAYGLSYAKMISHEWFNGGVIASGCEYANRRDYIINKRKFVRGEQSMEEFKKRLPGQLNLHNIDFRLVNLAEKFCRIVSNGIDDSHYRLDIRSNDALSLRLKQDSYNNHLKNMRTQPLMEKVLDNFGIDLRPEGFIPEDEEELKIYSEIEERPKVEISEEILINYIKKSNSWDVVEKAKNKDITDIGICASRTYTDPNEGIKYEYVDPEYLIHGPTRRNDFKDCNYYGYIDRLSIGDIKRESGFNDEDLRKLAQSSNAADSHGFNYEESEISEILSLRIDVLRFAFKTSKTTVYKKRIKKGKTVKLTKRDESFNPPKRTDYGRVADTKDTWMEGTYVIGTDAIYKYQECENIVRDELNKALPTFTVRAADMYKNKLKSFADNIETLADGLNETIYRIRHLRSKLRPDLVAIDLDSIADLVNTDEESEEEGTKESSWRYALDIMGVEGVVFTQRTNLGEKGIKESTAAKPVASQQGSALSVLLNLFAQEYNLIRETTGINPARDGSLPPDALLGVNKMAELASNTVTKHYVDAAIEHNLRVCETISSRVHTIFRNPNAKKLRKIYERAVGKQNIEALEALKDRHLHDFGFTVEILPAKQEIIDLRTDLDLEQKAGNIDVEVKYEALRIAHTNLKLANKYLFYQRKKRYKQKVEEQKELAANKSQNDINSNTAATQAKIQEHAAKANIDLDYQKKMVELDLYKKQAMLQIEAPEKKIDFEREVYKEQLKNINTLGIRQFQEEAKDNRLNTQSTHQSELIDQRNKKYKQPKDFRIEPIKI